MIGANLHFMIGANIAPEGGEWGLDSFGV